MKNPLLSVHGNNFSRLCTLKGPLVIRTSSSFLMGIDRTLCLSRRSFDNGADINFLRTLLGAEKYALRHFLLDDETLLFFFIVFCVGWLLNISDYMKFDIFYLSPC